MMPAVTAPAFTLNDEQRIAAETFTDNLLVLAGAGTGKTNTLACRVANLLSGGLAKPEEILCLTFTNRACREMTERVERMAGEAARGVTVKTVHAFCAWLLRETPGVFTDVGPDFSVCDADDAREILREVVFEVVGREPGDQALRVLQDFTGLVKDCWLARPQEDCSAAAAWAFVHRREEVERVCVGPDRRFDPKFHRFLVKYGASVVRLYNLKLLSSGLLDFSDLLIRAFALLADPRVSALWRERFRFVHVDEVQDVSLAEYGLLSGLCGNARVLLCGDFNQTIYQWRGSDPGALIARFTEEFHPRVIEFTVNYRSSPGLLAAGNAFLANAFGRGPGGGGHVEFGGDVVVRSFDTPADEIHWIYGQIASLGLTDFSRAAIITRTNKVCADVCGILRASRLDDSLPPVRFMLADELRLLKRAEVKDALACVSVAANPRDGEALARVLKRLVKGVGPATVGAVAANYREGGGAALADFFDPRTRNTGDFFSPLLDALAEGRVVVYDVESTGTDVYSDEIVQMAAVRLDPAGNVSERFERFLRPSRPVGDSEKVHGFTDGFLAERGEDPAKALGDFLRFCEGCVIVGHNVAFDVAITRRNLVRSGAPGEFGNVWYDTLDLSRRYLKNLENHKLLTVAAALGAANDPTHNAMDDILATADVLRALVKGYLLPGQEARRAFYAKYLPRLAGAASLVETARREAEGLGGPAAARMLLDRFGVWELYNGAPEKRANLQLFLDFADDFCDPALPPARQLSSLLELSALSSSELDRMSRSANKVAVITAHQSKGCEFDYVFLPVLQEGVFPTFQAARSGELEEEKRVFYVSITRARKKLFLTWSRCGMNNYPSKPSRFLGMLG